MLKRQRNILLVTFLVVVLAVAGIIYKTSIKPTISVPGLNDVRSIQVEFNSTQPNPKAISVDSSKHKRIARKLVSWMQSAKSVGYEKDIPMMSFGPLTAVIKLKSNKEIDISQAWLPTTLNQPDGRVLPASKRSDEYVDIQKSGSNKMIRYYSPKLASWLNGGWKNDWKQ